MIVDIIASCYHGRAMSAQSSSSATMSSLCRSLPAAVKTGRSRATVRQSIARRHPVSDVLMNLAAPMPKDVRGPGAGPTMGILAPNHSERYLIIARTPNASVDGEEMRRAMRQGISMLPTHRERGTRRRSATIASCGGRLNGVFRHARPVAASPVQPT